jgi:3-hydroxybutyryl-CoA dehydrogenase
MNEHETHHIARVGVVGCGVMGSGIAVACAAAGLDVVVALSGAPSLPGARARVLAGLDHGVRKGMVTAAGRDAALGRIRYATQLTDLADRQLVIEAVREHEPAKVEVFAALDKVVADDRAILASTTSATPIVRLARATGRPESVLGLHFFNPVPAMPLVELVASLLTGEQAGERAEAFVTGVLNKQVVRSPDRAGFTVNALLIPYLLAAARMAEAGHAEPADIDRAMVLGCAHPMGPLRLADLIGLDIVVAIAAALYEEFREPAYAPPPLLSRMVEAGRLGRKSGRGFYEYASRP